MPSTKQLPLQPSRRIALQKQNQQALNQLTAPASASRQQVSIPSLGTSCKTKLIASLLCNVAVWEMQGRTASTSFHV